MQNQDKLLSDLNQVFVDNKVDWKVISTAKKPTTGQGNDPIFTAPKPIDIIANHVFESFPGLVHLYILKTATGMPVKEYPYTDGTG
ncbi:MAG: hypothetical protein ACRC80_38210, partial [Waterburya sp.]